MLSDYSYHIHGKDQNNIVVVFPEIFGINSWVQEITDTLSSFTPKSCVALDYYFLMNGKKTVYESVTQKDMAIQDMKKYTGELFMEFFTQFLMDYKREVGDIHSITAIGFCFGGSIATYSGLWDKVTSIYTFYPGQNLREHFHKDSQTIIHALSNTRSKALSIYGFYGVNDSSISEHDRDIVLDVFSDSDVIDYHEYLFEAGHAFMNTHRESYVKDAADESRELIKEMLND